jgi:5'-3' exonuclease
MPIFYRTQSHHSAVTRLLNCLRTDMNHIIHSCTHAHVAKDRPDGLSRAEQFGGMAAYLESLLDLLEPR